MEQKAGQGPLRMPQPESLGKRKSPEKAPVRAWGRGKPGEGLRCGEEY